MTAAKQAQHTVKAVQQNARALGLTWDNVLATVIEGSDPSAVRILFDDSEDTNNDVPALSMIGALRPGVRVYVLVTPGGGAFIVGRPRAEGHYGYVMTLLNGSTQSGAFTYNTGAGVLIPNMTFTFECQNQGWIDVLAGVDQQCTVAGVTTCTTEIFVNGTLIPADHPSNIAYNSVTDRSSAITFGQQFVSVPGSYTIEVRGRKSSAGATVIAVPGTSYVTGKFFES